MFITKYKSHSPTLKSILDITQIITKAYQVQSNYTYLHSFNVWHFTQPKMPGVCIMSNILMP